MKLIVPPPLPVDLGDNDGSQRLQLRLQKVSYSALTILATAWCITLGPVPAVLACAVAKHVLVAILVMGTEPDRSRP